MKVADFGLAAKLGAKAYLSSNAGTWLYMAPEVYDHNTVHKSDVWALGITVFRMLGVPLPAS